MPEEVPKEAVDFLTRLGGATVSALEQLAFEWWWTTHPEARGQFPFTRPEMHLPMFHELIVAGLQIPPWVIGLLVEEDARKKGDRKTAEIADAVEKFGEGGVLYATPMLLHSTAVLNTPAKPPGATVPGSPVSPTATQGIVYKL